MAAPRARSDEYKARQRVRALERYHRRMRDPAYRERMREYHRARRAAGLVKPRRSRATGARPGPKPKPPAIKVPWEVRSLWRNADENSIIRRKYPTPRDLQRAAERGEFNGRV